MLQRFWVRENLSQVEITDNIMKMAADLARQAFCQGHRADIVLVETARTMAAFAERTYISLDDLKEAAELALPHRIRQVPPYEIQEQETQETEEKTPPQQMQQPPENEESRERPDLEQTPRIVNRIYRHNSMKEEIIEDKMKLLLTKACSSRKAVRN